jgi:hypothetical protein
MLSAALGPWKQPSGGVAGRSVYETWTRRGALSQSTDAWSRRTVVWDTSNLVDERVGYGGGIFIAMVIIAAQRALARRTS